MKASVAMLLLLALGCARGAETPAHDEDAEITKWRAARLARLKSEDGWLSLVNLQWLNEGENKIEKPAVGGVVTLQKGVVTLQPNASLTIGGKPVSAPTVLVDDGNEHGPTTVMSGTVRFYVHAVKMSDGARYAIRVKDPASPARTHFVGLDYFPISSNWRVEARFEPFHPPHHLAVANVLGGTTDEIAPGRLMFQVAGKEYSVEPILEQGEKDYFIIFKDATSGKETYAAARYVYAPPPDKSGRTVIDFNKAYNPPCSFTQFATCPLPPPQNRLPFRVEAGEKKYRGGH
jgi:uncharacterized protein (DUF1684 family)